MILVTGSVDDLDEKLVRAIRGDAFFYLHAREGGAGLALDVRA